MDRKKALAGNVAETEVEPSGIQTLFGDQGEDEQISIGEEDNVGREDSGNESKIIPIASSGSVERLEVRREGVFNRGQIVSPSDHGFQSENGNVLRPVSEVKVIDQKHGDRWALFNADSCSMIKGVPDNSIHFQVMSPPFADLFVYSSSDRDLGNCKSDAEFFEHYRFLVKEQLRVAVPGRLCAIHVMQLPTSKVKHGVIGLRDFRGDVIRVFQGAGWIYHSEVCIWKNPVTAMQRTKALGLLHKQIKKDSCMSRQGVADYLVIFRKPGINPDPVKNTNDSFPVEVWQRYASPVWATLDAPDEDGIFSVSDCHTEERDDDGTINQGSTLQRKSAREQKDERHLCVLQKGVIRRAVKLWSNPGDIVASWFAGIGSEGFVALEMGRRFIGSELKRSYFEQACRNLDRALSITTGLFADQSESAKEMQEPATADEMDF